MSKQAAWKIPSFQNLLLIVDDPQLAAEASAILREKGKYLPIIDGPRMQRPDVSQEVTRRINVAARLKPNLIIFLGIEAATIQHFQNSFPSKIVRSCNSIEDLHGLEELNLKESFSELEANQASIGSSLLNALYANSTLEYSEHAPTISFVKSRNGHLIVCEGDEPLSEVIAANYAYSLGAGFLVIPRLEKAEEESICDTLYSLQDTAEKSATESFSEIKNYLHAKIADLGIENHQIITFVSHRLPWGISFPNIPSTHLFIYPDLGASILHGMLAESAGSDGIRIGAVIEPGDVDAQELDSLKKSLLPRGVLIRPLRGAAANVYSATKFLELIPFDFLLICSHCGDADGWRWTYEFEDNSGRKREFVVDVAIGVGDIPHDERFEVTQYNRFVSLDGVSWSDPAKKEKIIDYDSLGNFIEDIIGDSDIEPNTKVKLGRVAWSGALKLHDFNMLYIDYSIANNGTPLIINNACSSWHSLGERFTYANARGYIGTLFDVTNIEASEVVNALFDKHFGKPLALALWHAQNGVYGDGQRRPYVMLGPHFQRLRVSAGEQEEYLLTKLTKSLLDFKQSLGLVKDRSSKEYEQVSAKVRYLTGEIQGIQSYIARIHRESGR